MAEYDASDDSEELASEGEAGGVSPKDIALFALRALRLNLAFSLLIATVVGVLGSTVVAAIPPVYDATFKIFFQEGGGQVTTQLASGRDRHTSMAGVRGLEELILARHNLMSIVREAKLVDTWPATRALPMRIKDRVMGSLFGSASRGDMERAFAEMLTTSITATKEGESVRVHTQWRASQDAYQIAVLVQRNFLAARAALDMGPVRRAIPFLESQLQQADQEIEGAVVRIQSRMVSPDDGNNSNGSKERASAKPAAGGDESQAARAGTGSLGELSTLSRELADTRRRSRALIEPWRRRVSELKLQLADAKVSYSDDHPIVMQLQARADAAAEVPEELAELRQREAELMSRLSTREATPPAPAQDDASSRHPAEERAAEVNLEPAKSRLYAALRKSDQISERLESALIELATAEADFNHRYVVVEQPEVPGKPLKAKKGLLYVVVFVAAMLLGIISATARELLKGRMVAPWQVRSLGLPLLAEVELKRLPQPSKKA